MTSPLILELP